jgi:hypothetical protein
LQQMNSRLSMAAWVVAALMPCLSAQSAISARSGMIHYTEGRVYLDDQRVEVKITEFPEWKERQVLKTVAGRAEILLTPGVFLRVAENSSLRMDSNKLWDVKIALLEGEALIEAGQVDKTSSLRITLADSVIDLNRAGLYRISATENRVRVYEGEVRVTAAGGTSLAVKEGREAELGSALVATKFDAKQGDAFYRWASRRAETIAMANLSAARSSQDSWSTVMGMQSADGLWRWNPIFGMFTYVPLGRSYVSPFRAVYFSPRAVSRVYERPRPVMPMPTPGFGGDASMGSVPVMSRGVYVGGGGGYSGGAPAAGGGGEAGRGGGGGVSRGDAGAGGRGR